MWISRSDLTQILETIFIKFASTIVTPLIEEVLKGQSKIMAEIDDLKTAVAGLVADQTAFNAAQTQFNTDLSKTLADIQTKLGTPGISAADVEAAAVAIGGVKTAVDANITTVRANDKTLTDFDATLNPPPPKPAV